MKHSRLLALPLFCLSLTLPALASSLHDEIEVERTYLSASKKDLVAQAMSLDAATATTFWPLYNEYQDALRPLGDRKVQLIMSYAQDYDHLSDAKAKQLTDDYLKIQDDFLSVQKQYLKKFRKLFPDTLVARYFQVENKLNAVINLGLAKNIPLVPLAETH